MKFGKQLQLGIYPPWKDNYIAYDKLKRIIGRLKFLQEKEKVKQISVRDKDNKDKDNKESNEDENDIEKKGFITELTPLRSPDRKISNEYTTINDESDGLDFFSTLKNEIFKINKFYSSKLTELRVRVEDVVEKWKTIHQSHHTNLSTSYLSELKDVYIQLDALQSFADLNKTGVYKIVKKHDKMLGEKTLQEWLDFVNTQDFATSTEIGGLMDIITRFVSRDKLLEWQKNELMEKLEQQDNIMPSVKPLQLFVSIILFIISFQLPAIAPDNPPANRCLSILILAISLWLTVAIPYFATALVIPVLITTMSVLKDETNPQIVLSPSDSAKFVLNHFFNHTTMLLLGGYTLSSAFSRCQLELRAAAWMQKRFGHSPLLFLLAIMFLGLFLSMWISNHTAPILCCTMLLPLVRDLPKDSKYTKSLLLGVAISCNFGGMMTPISSLQNALAVSNLEKVGINITFSQWIFLSLPFGSLCTIISWIILCIIMEPYDVKSIPIVVYRRDNTMNKRNITVIVLSLITMIAFSTFEYTLKNIFGDIAMIALIYIAIMFGSGMLTELDFNSLSWHTLFLLGGGSTLGKAVESSGLLECITTTVTSKISTDDPWIALLSIYLFALIIATFVSHTVASMILMPLVTQIGFDLQIPKMMVIGTALTVSAAMALPFSSFPNVNSMLIVDDFQSPYLTTKDFIITGLPLSLISVLLIGTIGYHLVEIIM